MKVSTRKEKEDYYEELVYKWCPTLRNRELCTTGLLKWFKLNDELRLNKSEDKLCVLAGVQQYGSGKTAFGKSLLQLIQLTDGDSDYRNCNVLYCSLAYVTNSQTPSYIKQWLDKLVDAGDYSVLVIDQILRVFLCDVDTQKAIWNNIGTYLGLKNYRQIVMLGRGAPVHSDMIFSLSPFIVKNLALNTLKANHIESMLIEDLNIETDTVQSYKIHEEIYKLSAGIPLVVTFMCALMKYSLRYSPEYKMDEHISYAGSAVYNIDRVKHILTVRNKSVNMPTLLYKLIFVKDIQLSSDITVDSGFIDDNTQKVLPLQECLNDIGLVYDLTYENEKEYITIRVPELYFTENYFALSALLDHKLFSRNFFYKNLSAYLTKSVLRKKLGILLFNTKTVGEIMNWSPEPIQHIKIGNKLLQFVKVLGIKGDRKSSNHEFIMNILNDKAYPKIEFPTEKNDFIVKGIKEPIKEAGIRYFIKTLAMIKTPTILLPLSKNGGFDEAVYFPDCGALWFLKDKNYSEIGSVIDGFNTLIELLRPYIGKRLSPYTSFDEYLNQNSGRVVLDTLVFTCINNNNCTNKQQLLDGYEVNFVDNTNLSDNYRTFCLKL